METLLNRASYSVKQVQAISLELGLDKDELDRQIISLNKTMIGKEGVVDLLLQVSITIYADELGVYSPDQLIRDLEKHLLTPTYNGAKLSEVLKYVWKNVSPVLHTHPKGHKFIKELIVHTQKELGSKISTGNKQMRTCVKMKALELFKDFN